MEKNVGLSHTWEYHHEGRDFKRTKKRGSDKISEQEQTNVNPNHVIGKR
jgi:hypothetical protein